MVIDPSYFVYLVIGGQGRAGGVWREEGSVWDDDLTHTAARGSYSLLLFCFILFYSVVFRYYLVLEIILNQ